MLQILLPKRILTILFRTGLIAAVVTGVFCGSLCAEEAVVRYVIDGDTVLLQDGRKVRLIGIDAPEIKDDNGRNKRNAARFNADPGRVRQAALDAKDFLSAELTSKAVDIRTDRVNASIGHKDRYGRLLAYIHPIDGKKSYNAILIEKGLAFVYRRFQFQRKGFFIGLEEEAKKKQNGLWQKSAV